MNTSAPAPVEFTTSGSLDAARLAELANGLRVSQALYVAAQLGIADHLAQQSLDARALAVVTGTDPSALRRIMRALCAVGVFAETASGQFALTSVGQLLRSDVLSSHRAGVLFMAGPVRWRCWSQLLDAVKTGENRSQSLLGMQLFDYYAANPAESKLRDDAMRSFSAAHGAALVATIDIGKARLVVDVGGGTGALLAAILTAHPDVRGVLFDLPYVVARAAPVFEAANVAKRCAIEGGSFLERVPEGGDLYLLKQILHDWDDAEAAAILGRCARAMPRGARVLVIERRLPDQAKPNSSIETFLVDLEMLVMAPGGRERTDAEYRKLFADAGLEHVITVPTASSLFVFEARR